MLISLASERQALIASASPAVEIVTRFAHALSIFGAEIVTGAFGAFGVVAFVAILILDSVGLTRHLGFVLMALCHVLSLAYFKDYANSEDEQKMNSG